MDAYVAHFTLSIIDAFDIYVIDAGPQANNV